MHNINLLTSWEDFTQALELRFGPYAYENHQQTLFKLRQTTAVTEYQKTFETLCDSVVGLTPTAILDCFISGLKPEIQLEMAILKPTSISQAIGLAKLIESKLQASRPLHHPHHRPPPPKYTPSLVPTPPLMPATSNRLALPPPTTPKSPFPICRLSPAEQDVRRAKGLCFNCDDRFHTGHRCKAPHFLILLPEEEDTNQPTDDDFYLFSTPTPPEPHILPYPHLQTYPLPMNLYHPTHTLNISTYLWMLSKAIPHPAPYFFQLLSMATESPS